MCGRFTQYEPLEFFVEAVSGALDDSLRYLLSTQEQAPRYNITPGTKIWTMAANPRGERVLRRQNWGFQAGRRMHINARRESVHHTPSFEQAFAAQRAVVLANGFYEPKGPKSSKNRPWYYFEHADGAPLFLVAIYNAHGIAILTQAPTGPVADIHDRSPVFMPPHHVNTWLTDPTPSKELLDQLTSPTIAQHLRYHPVSDAAKSPKNEGKSLIEPI